jgi:membrane protease YdiL (CAAX protease family)
MTVATTHVSHRSALEPLVLVGAFAAAVVIRVEVAGPAGPGSVRAGLTFAVVLAALALMSRVRLAVTLWGSAAGLIGAAVLVLPVVISHGLGGHLDATGYASWASATVVVATAEEAFLRGALYDAVARAHGVDVAIVVAAVAFAALHVPLYGWHVLPLDLAVGLALGALRLVTGTWTAPAIAHVGADLIGWWLL